MQQLSPHPLPTRTLSVPERIEAARTMGWQNFVSPQQDRQVVALYGGSGGGGRPWNATNLSSSIAWYARKKRKRKIRADMMTAENSLRVSFLVLSLVPSAVL